MDVSGREKGTDKADEADDIEGDWGSASTSATTMPGSEVEWRSGIELEPCRWYATWLFFASTSPSSRARNEVAPNGGAGTRGQLN